LGIEGPQNKKRLGEKGKGLKTTTTISALTEHESFPWTKRESRFPGVSYDMGYTEIIDPGASDEADF